jgi:hypothetical protein
MSFPLLINILLFFNIHTFSGLVDFAMPASQNGIKFVGGGGGSGPQTDKHLPQSPFTGQLF